jgi:hypothetical protein
MSLEWSQAAAKSWAGYIELYGVYGTQARRKEERRWYGEMARGNPAALEHLLASRCRERIEEAALTLLSRQAYRDKLAAWHAECAHRARQALLLRLRANTGAAATTGRNYRIWRRYEEGKLSLAAVGKEFGISGRRVGQIVARQREILPLRQKIWAEKRHNLGRPLDIDANQEDYRGKWLYD